MQMTPASARRTAQAIAATRIGLGLAALLAPRAAIRVWAGSPRRGDESRTDLLARSLAGRDIALGLGLILAIRHDEAARGWVEAGALADAVDALGSAVSFGTLPRLSRVAVLAASAGTCGLGGYLARLVDRTR